MIKATKSILLKIAAVAWRIIWMPILLILYFGATFSERCEDIFYMVADMVNDFYDKLYDGESETKKE